ncbi:putative sensor histidine kinase pdtaS [Palleronia abyssalis]|uniref:histidine kinase n=1 Tax=Palleronia abyssalis TaxID=1501240 RepID=A0A2R8BQ90_9RHOB|nr:putative sensor histidine kinase pdtaS [Palleronia abyssalis]
MFTPESVRARRTLLRQYGLSDSVDLSSLNDIVTLAVRMCEVKTGTITLFGDDRQRYVLNIGMKISELPLDETICAHVLSETGVTVIPDTQADQRTRDLAVCNGIEGFRFYAAAPLRAGNGRVIGTLTMLDPEPRDLNDDQRMLLVVMAKQVMAQLDLRRALRRADLMRREVDHRVKNSLQSVASLTRLQARRVTSTEAREALEIVSRRIDTVAALNSELYRIGNDRKVGLSGFLASVIDLIRSSAPERVTISLECADVNISARHAGSLAIIVNEFTTNSFKHAFPDDRAGHIEISGRQTTPGTFVLTCRDDGIGFSGQAPGNGLGFAIIDSAVESVDGEIERGGEAPGHEIKVEFGI